MEGWSANSDDPALGLSSRCRSPGQGLFMHTKPRGSGFAVFLKAEPRGGAEAYFPASGYRVKRRTRKSGRAKIGARFSHTRTLVRAQHAQV
jgi:hypothetical protein